MTVSILKKQGLTLKKQLFIGISFGFSVILMLLPLCVDYPWLRPQWPLLVLFYWVIYLAEGFGFSASWCLGLLIDLFTSALLGTQALRLLLFNIICTLFKNRLRLYRPLVKMLVMMIALLFSEFPLFIIVHLLGQPQRLYYAIMSLCLTLLLWPFVYTILNYYDRKVFHAR